MISDIHVNEDIWCIEYPFIVCGRLIRIDMDGLAYVRFNTGNGRGCGHGVFLYNVSLCFFSELDADKALEVYRIIEE